MRQQCLMIREPGKLIPEGYKKKFLETYNFGLGYASPQGGKLIDFELFPSDETSLEEALTKFEEAYKDDRIVWWGAKADEGELNFNSFQPFELLSTGENENKVVLMSAFLEGEFPDFDQPMEEEGEDGAATTAEFRFVQYFLAPLVDELNEMANGDVSLVMSYLDKKVQMDKIKAKLGPRATVLIVPCKGSVKAFAQNNDGGSYSWGFVTRSLGYKEEAAATNVTAPAASSKKPNIRDQAKGPSHKTDTSPPEVVYAAILKSSNFRLVNGELYVNVAKGSDWKTTRTWWNNHIAADRPEDTKLVYFGRPATDLKPNSSLREFMVKNLGGAKAESVQGPADPPKDANKEPPKEVLGMTLHLAKNHKENWLKLKQNGKLKKIDDAKLKSLVSDYPMFSVQLGEQFSDILDMTPEAYARIINDVGAHAGVILLHEMRCRIKGIATPGVQEPEKKVVEPPKEVPATAPATSGKKPSLREQAQRKAG